MAQNKILFSELFHFTPRQLDFLRAIKKYKYVLFGGAKGGGKSYALRWILVYYLLVWAQKGHKGVRVGLFCEDYPSLKDRQITKIEKEFPSWLGELSNSQTQGMSFQIKECYGGGVIALRNLDDISKYASSEFAIIAVDELTKNNREMFDQFRSILRWPGIEDTKFIGGTNPGGVGNMWVKQLWIDRKFRSDDPLPEQVEYIRSLPVDNPYNAQSYIDELSRLPERKRKAYFEGSWDVMEGQFFNWDSNVHIVKPFTIPETWRRFGAYDHGRAKPACFIWFAIDYDQNVYAYRELYVNKEDGSPRWEADAIGREVHRITSLAGERLEYVVADSAIFTKTGHADTIAGILQKNGVGGSDCIPLMLPSHKDRLAGWALVHQYLRYDNVTPPKLKLFENCINGIETIPSLIHDDVRVEDCDSSGEDHFADALRYFLQTLKGKHTSLPMTLEQRSEENFNRKIGKIKENSLALSRFDV